MAQRKLAKTCDQCKDRKIRFPPEPNSSICNNCKNRRLPCRFGFRKQRARRIQRNLYLPLENECQSQKVGHRPTLTSASDGHASIRTDLAAMAQGVQDTGPLPTNTDLQHPAEAVFAPGTHAARLFVDHLLDGAVDIDMRQDEGSLVKARDKYIGSSGIAFFSDERIASITDRLGHQKFQKLFETLEASMNAQIRRSPAESIKFYTPPAPLHISAVSSKNFSNAYFEHVHPVFPFLDRREFEELAFNEQCERACEEKHAFSALYHTVLALGCQYHNGGSFQPGLGMAWKLFQVALGNFPEMLVPKETLMRVQAVTAMAIFAHNSSCVQIGNLFTTEAARMAQSLGINREIYGNGKRSACRRTFWVTYILEKTQSFACGRDSVFNDANISTPVPNIPEATFDGFDWFRAICRFSRLLSRIQSSLFTTSSTLSPLASTRTAIDDFHRDLETWRQSITDRFRPERFPQTFFGTDSTTMAVKLRIRYHYYSALIALARVQINASQGESSQHRSDGVKHLIDASNAIIDLTRYIDVEPYMPIWILLSVPLSALFVLFDVIIHNPLHTETRANLALLGVASGYFCRLEFATHGSLLTSPLSELAEIARKFIHDLESVTSSGRADGSLFCGLLDEGQAGSHPAESISTVQTPVGGFGAEGCSNESSATPIDEGFFPLVDRWQDSIDLTSFFATTLPTSIDVFDNTTFTS